MLKFFFKDSAISLHFLHFFSCFWYFLSPQFSFFRPAHSKKYPFSAFSFFRKAFTFLGCLVFSFTEKSGFFRNNLNFFAFFLHKGDVLYRSSPFFSCFMHFCSSFSLFVQKSSLLLLFCLFSFVFIFCLCIFSHFSLCYHIAFPQATQIRGTVHFEPRPCTFFQTIFLIRHNVLK